MQTGIEPYKSFERFLHYWWWLFICILTGGLLGLIGHVLKEPVYQASTSLSISIDYTRTGFMTDIEEDQIFGVVGDVIGSDAVLQLVVEQATQTGQPLTLTELKDTSFQERKAYEWVMHVRDRDAEVSANLANWWAQAAYQGLNRALEEALLAANLQEQMDGLVSCLDQTVATQPDQAICQLTEPELRAEIKQTGDQIQQARLISQGIDPALLFSPPQMVSTPVHPAVFQQGALVLVGALLGLIVGCLSLIFGFPPGLVRKLVFFVVLRP